MKQREVIETLITEYDSRQELLEPYLEHDANAGEVYEQLEIQKLLFTALEVSDVAALSIPDQESYVEQLQISQDTLAKTDRLIELMKEMYGVQ